ncbi:putative aluminum-activated malate transporter [Helianthus anomalus]
MKNIVSCIGALATYCRFIPSINKRYDYGVAIFILSFNLVTASSFRAHKFVELARKRLSAVGMGFIVSICVALLVFPMWASDEFHHLASSKFNDLASCIEGGNFDPFAYE